MLFEIQQYENSLVDYSKYSTHYDIGFFQNCN